MTKATQTLANALWRVYRRPDRPTMLSHAWEYGGNLPWHEPDFSRRMLREHLDDSHGAASRRREERQAQLEWLWAKVALHPGAKVLDLTCGPGLYAVALALRGCRVTGVDFSPAAIEYARELAESSGVAGECTFIQRDVREVDFSDQNFDCALFLYGQLAVFQVREAQSLLQMAARALRPGGRLCVELLDQERVDKEDSNWWYTDDQGLWGEAPFLHLAERFWDAESKLSIERFHIIHLESGKMNEITLCDQTYAKDEMVGMMRDAGFAEAEVVRAWDNLPLADAREWNVYLARKGG